MPATAGNWEVTCPTSNRTLKSKRLAALGPQHINGLGHAAAACATHRSADFTTVTFLSGFSWLQKESVPP